ncbi:hypothetical protein DXG01_000011 [Tephrocybe rancida]|nr:hypothetical protein DXG01_000011 [Tephrocybe rancida]
MEPTAQESTREWREAMAEKSKVAMDEKFQRDVAPLASRSNTLRVTLKMPYQWAFSIFALLYSGNETTTQGFVNGHLSSRDKGMDHLLCCMRSDESNVSQHANPKTVGYVTSGYWGGFALARFIWGYFLYLYAEKIHRSGMLEYAPLQLEAMMMLTAALFLALAVVMHILIRVIDSNMENSVNVALIGFLYGPIFPAILRLTNDILPPEVQMISMGLISAFASVGSVLIGIWSLFPTRLPVRTITV